MKTLQIIVMSSIGVLLSVLVLTVLALFILNKSILSSNAPDVMKLIVLAVAPPKDFYDYLINEELNVSTKGFTKRFMFKNKYVGRHIVGILLDKFTDDLYFVPIVQRYNLKLIMEVNFYTQNSLILSHLVENKYSPFIGRKWSGFSFFTYDCPKDLPLDKLITCEVKVIEPDSTLNAAYGPARFYINKTSDK
jgi:hypothetical protein